MSACSFISFDQIKFCSEQIHVFWTCLTVDGVCSDLCIFAGDRLEVCAAVCPGRFHVCLLARCKIPCYSKILFTAAYVRVCKGCLECVICFLLLQVAADVNAVAQEVEAALELLQKRVLCFLLNTIWPWTDKTERKLTCRVYVYSCVAL